MRLLFVCSRNRWRSPTAERLFRNRPGFEVRSGGTSPKARRRVSARDLEWANLVLAMESQHRRQLAERFGRNHLPRVAVLDVPDEYEAMDPELIELLEGRVAAALAEFGA